MWNETAVHKNGHVINKAGLHLWMPLYVANSVELDVNTDLQQISAALFDNRQAIPTWFYGVLRAFESDQVMILKHDTATRLELRENIRLVSESLVCLIVCSVGDSQSSKAKRVLRGIVRFYRGKQFIIHKE